MNRKLFIISLLSFCLLSIGCKKDDFEGKDKGTFTDPRDGVVYKWVRIGEQVWMAENLKATKYNDDTDIANVTDDADWAVLTSGAYCWYENDKVTYGNTYGALYNWYAVNSGKLCPTGWHVPTDDEWQQLVDYAGGDDTAGSRLKATSGWYNNGNGTDEYGFTALPGGSRISDGNFHNVGYFGDWWSSTEYGEKFAWYRIMYHFNGFVFRGNPVKKNGFSVRCVRD